MKVGDLVRYVDEDYVKEEQQGIIVGGPKKSLERDPLPSQWQVAWTASQWTLRTGPAGWWNEGYLEVISELA